MMAACANLPTIARFRVWARLGFLSFEKRFKKFSKNLLCRAARQSVIGCRDGLQNSSEIPIDMNNGKSTGTFRFQQAEINVVQCRVPEYLQQ